MVNRKSNFGFTPFSNYEIIINQQKNVAKLQNTGKIEVDVNNRIMTTIRFLNKREVNKRSNNVEEQCVRG